MPRKSNKKEAQRDNTNIPRSAEKANVLQTEIDELATIVKTRTEAIPEVPVGGFGSSGNEKFIAVINAKTAERDVVLLRLEKKQVQKIGLDLSANIEPNILSQYENTAYNLRFFMTREDVNHDTVANEEIMVIAETGSTGFNITELNIHSIIAPGPVNKNTTSDVLSFTIIEPHGNRLFDQIRNGAAALGIFDHLKAPYWFEVSFKGYSPPGADSFTGGTPGGKSDDHEDLNNFQFLYKIEVTNIIVETDQGGTVYKFQSVPFDQGQGFKDSARRLETNESINAQTLGEYFEKLSKTLNDSENYSIRNVTDNNIRIRKYAFSFAKEFKSMVQWQIMSSAENKTENKRSGRPTIDDDGEIKQIRFNSGTPIEAVIQEVIGATQQGQSLALFGTETEDPDQAGDQGEQATRKADTPVQIFMIEPIVDILGYNPVSNLYNILITYHIRPYKSFKPLASREEIKKFKFTESITRLKSLIKIANVKKSYDFVFTGLNTEVLDYKINFEYAWWLPLPLFRGQNRDGVAMAGSKSGTAYNDGQVEQRRESNPSADQANKSIGSKSNQDLILLEKELQDKFNEFSGGPEGATIFFRKKLEIVQTEITKRSAARFAASNIDIARKKVNVLQFGAGANSIVLGSDIIDRTATDVRRGGNSITVIGADAARQKVDSIRIANQAKNTLNGSIFFIEDVANASVGPTAESEDTQRQLYTVSNEISATQSTYLGNIEGTISKGRPYFTAIMNQMYGSSGDMVKLDLSVRGDPYWLGEPNPRARLDPPTNATGSDLTASDVYILMTFDFPVRFDDGGFGDQADSFKGTGLADLERGENGFNGIYLITEITSEFSDGKFTQKLTGQIDGVTNEQDFISLIIGTRT